MVASRLVQVVELVVVELEMVVAVCMVLGEVEVVEGMVVKLQVVEVEMVVAVWMVLVEVVELVVDELVLAEVEIVMTVLAETGSAHQA